VAAGRTSGVRPTAGDRDGLEPRASASGWFADASCGLAGGFDRLLAEHMQVHSPPHWFKEPRGLKRFGQEVKCADFQLLNDERRAR